MLNELHLSFTIFEHFQLTLLTRIQMKNFMLLIMLISLSNFVAGSIMGPENELEQAQGLIGYSGT